MGGELSRFLDFGTTKNSFCLVIYFRVQLSICSFVDTCFLSNLGIRMFDGQFCVLTWLGLRSPNTSVGVLVKVSRCD